MCVFYVYLFIYLFIYLFTLGQHLSFSSGNTLNLHNSCKQLNMYTLSTLASYWVTLLLLRGSVGTYYWSTQVWSWLSFTIYWSFFRNPLGTHCRWKYHKPQLAVNGAFLVEKKLKSGSYYLTSERIFFVKVLARHLTKTCAK